MCIIRTCRAGVGVVTVVTGRRGVVLEADGRTTEGREGVDVRTTLAAIAISEPVGGGPTSFLHSGHICLRS